MKQDATIVRLDSIDAYNKLYGLETKHPLVTVIDLTEATKVVNHVRMDYDVYGLFLKNGTNRTLKYGRQLLKSLKYTNSQILEIPNLNNLLFQLKLLF